MYAPFPISAVLIGREREVARLRRALDAALAGHGSVALIGGEAGIGKTILAEALCREASERGALVLVGRCYDLSETPPYGPWVELFAAYRDEAREATLPAAFARCGTVGAVGNPALLAEDVRTFLRAITGASPVVLLFDDLHWSDPASIELLRAVARDTPALPLLILATYRAEDVRRGHPLHTRIPALAREASAQRIVLHRLAAGAIGRLAAGRYPLPPVEAERLARHLYARAEGNPFFTVELLHAMEDAEALIPERDGWRLGDIAGVRLPALLRQVIDVRLARLGEQAERLLAIAAVLGQEVDPSLWSTVAEEDEETILAVAERAIAAHILEPSAGIRVRFVHALIRDTIYEGQLAARRAEWHRRAAEALITEPDPDPDAVAYHFRQSGDARARDWLVAAGQRAERAAAFATALARYEEALPFLAAEQDRAARCELLLRCARIVRLADPARCLRYAEEATALATGLGDRTLTAAALYRRGSVHGYAGNYRQGLADLEAARAAFIALSRTAPLRLAKLAALLHSDQSTVAGEIAGAIANTLQIMGRYEAALRALGYAPGAMLAVPGTTAEIGESGMTALSVTATAIGEPAIARAASAHGREHLRQRRSFVSLAFSTAWELNDVVLPYAADDLEERARLAAEAEEAARQEADVTEGYPPRTARAGLMVVEGEWAEAWRLLLAAHAARHLPGWRLAELRFLAYLARERGEPERAWAIIRSALPDGPATEPGGVYFINGTAFQRLAAALALDVGDLADGRAWLDAHDRWLAWSGAVLGRAEGLVLWARYAAAMDDGAGALVHARMALAHATGPRQPLALLAAHRLLGQLTARAGDLDAAHAHFTGALALADACAAPYERALTLLALAALYADAGDAAAARAVLGEARATFARLGAPPALARADALDAQLAATPIPAYPAGLSAREVEVLRLVADGLTDREVAERLSLSRRTVSQHLRSVYNKLGVASRAAATRFASEHGLLPAR